MYDNTKFILSDRLYLPALSDSGRAITDRLQYIASMTGDTTFKPTRSGEYLAFPRHFFDSEILAGLPNPYSEGNYEWMGPLSFPKLDGKCFIEPHPEDVALATIQADAFSFLARPAATPAHADSIVSLRCGGGKSLIGLRGIFDRGQAGLIVAHTTDILHNWEEEIRKFTDVRRVGRIISGSFDLQPLSLALADSLLVLTSSDVELVSQMFGTVVLDEYHHYSARTFNIVANMFFGARIGLTATLVREDGLSERGYRAIGRKIFWRAIKRQKAKVSQMFVPVTDIDFPYDNGKAMSALAASEQYLQTLCDHIRAAYLEGHKQLILSSRKNLLWALWERLRDLDPAVNVRETPADQRHINLRTKKIVMSIDRYGKEGLNDKDLTYLRVITPVKDPNALEQMVGRIERENRANTAVLYCPTYGPMMNTARKAKKALINRGYFVSEELL